MSPAVGINLVLSCEKATHTDTHPFISSVATRSNIVEKMLSGGGLARGYGGARYKINKSRSWRLNIATSTFGSAKVEWVGLTLHEK